MARVIRFGGPNLKRGESTWFLASSTTESDPATGEEVQVGGNHVTAYHGDEFNEEDFGNRYEVGIGEESWADYHVRTGRAQRVDATVEEDEQTD